MLPIPIIMALAAEFAPSVVGLLTKDKTAAKAAEMVSQTARAITGTSSDDAALEALRNDPDKAIEYKNAMNEHAADMYEKETERMKVASDAIHLEHTNKFGFIRNVRPLFGYCVIYMIFITFTSAAYTIVFKSPKEGVEVIKAYSEMEWIFIAALSAISVYIKKRSDDKKPNNPLGILGALAKRIGK